MIKGMSNTSKNLMAKVSSFNLNPMFMSRSFFKFLLNVSV